jgi:hypothetical protein
MRNQAEDGSDRLSIVCSIADLSLPLPNRVNLYCSVGDHKEELLGGGLRSYWQSP